LKLFIFIILFSFSFQLFSNSKFEMKERVLVDKRGLYVYIDEKTPEYIKNAIFEKGLNPAFVLRGAQVAWIRKNINYFKKMKPFIIVMGLMSDLEKGYLNDALKVFNYNASLLYVVYSKNDKNQQVLLNTIHYLEKTEKKGEVNFTLSAGKISEKGKKLSALDDFDFKDSVFVKEAVVFPKKGFGLINIESLKAKKEIVPGENIIFWENQKTVELFIKEL